MKNSVRKCFCTKRLPITGMLLTLFAYSFGTFAQESTAIDEEQLIQRITEAVINELRSSKLLDEEIDEGIRRFIREQQAAEARAAGSRAKNVRPVLETRDHIYGDPKAEVSIVEYSDFECPYCKRFHKTPRKVVDAYGGKVNWVYRHFPLAFHNPGAQKQAEASECATEQGGNDAFWRYTDLIYERTRSNGRGFPIRGLIPLAEEIGLNSEAFKTCLESGRYAGKVKEDYDNGVKSGISGTPGNILLNNRTGEAVAKSGAVPFSVLKQEIDQLLAP